MIKPKGKASVAYELGRKSFDRGLGDNPYRKTSRRHLTLASWWDAGYSSRKREEQEKS